jgi:hypothetical protein
VTTSNKFYISNWECVYVCISLMLYYF